MVLSRTGPDDTVTATTALTGPLPLTVEFDVPRQPAGSGESVVEAYGSAPGVQGDWERIGVQAVEQDTVTPALALRVREFSRAAGVSVTYTADVIATALLLRTIWVANSLDVILVMTGGGPGYATHTLPLYAFVRAYSSMEFGYAAALALILTLLLLTVVWLYVRRASRDLDR